MAKCCSFIYSVICHYIFASSLSSFSVDGQLGQFHILAIIYSAAMNIDLIFELLFLCISLFLDVYQGVLDHIAVLFLAF